jgi:hypothetical protein
VERLQQLSHKTSQSHLWLSVIPSDPTLTIPTDAMKLSVRFRLGLTPYETMPSQCVCCDGNVFATDPYHAFTCPTLRSHGSIFRHNLLLNSIATWASRAGILTEVEAGQLSSDARLRPDIVLSIGSAMHIVDATIVHSLSKTNIRRSTCRESGVPTLNATDSEVVMSAASAAEELKRSKYKRLVEENHAQFSTAAMETTGGFGKEFRELISFVSLVAQEEHSGWEPNEVINGIR